MATYKLICLENPLLDIQAQGDEALLKKYNLKANDAILADPATNHLELYADLTARDAKLIAGGAAQNSARGAQYILPPASVLFIGAVGQDEAAATLDKACAQTGLATEYLRLADQPTGRCGVVITGHNRSLCTDLAAANHYKLEHLQQPSIWAQVQAASIYYVGGYHLTVCPPAAEALGKEAAATNKLFVLNISAPFIAQFFAEPLKALLPYTDFVLGNETEAATWGEANGLKGASVADVAVAIAKTPKVNASRQRTVVITQGTDPTLVATADGNVAQFPVHAIDAAQIVDTNGAGDAFAGGFLAGLVEGKDMKASVDLGQWLARLSIQELGPSYPFPKQTYSA